MVGESVQRLRAIYAKGEPVKYISHLDLMRALERAFRRADLPLVYSQGYNPRPRFAFGSALPVGVTGEREVLDLWLSPPLEPREFLQRLEGRLPAGIAFREAWEVDARLPSLQSAMRSAEYEVTLDGEPPDLEQRLAKLLASETLPRRRAYKGRMRLYDLRPLIEGLWLLPGGKLGLRLANRSGATGRADEVLDALGLWEKVRAIVRTRVVWEETGNRNG